MLTLIIALLISTTPANLDADIKAAKPGDTLTLAAGDYGVRRYTNIRRVPAITIDATAAHLDGLRFDASAGIHVVGGTYGPQPVGGSGIYFDLSDDVSVSKASITGLDYGVVFSRSINVSLADSSIEGFRVDGLRLFCVQNGYVGRVRALAGSPVDRHKNHPDGIQIASTCGSNAPRSKIASDIVIEDSVVVTDGQGITAYHHPGEDDGFDRITYRRNSVIVTYPDGIALQGCRECTVTDNSVQSLPGYSYKGAGYRLEGTTGTITKNAVTHPPSK